MEAYRCFQRAGQSKIALYAASGTPLPDFRDEVHFAVAGIAHSCTGHPIARLKFRHALPCGDHDPGAAISPRSKIILPRLHLLIGRVHTRVCAKSTHLPHWVGSGQSLLQKRFLRLLAMSQLCTRRVMAEKAVHTRMPPGRSSGCEPRDCSLRQNERFPKWHAW